ncbi:hypothetical protein EG68_05396 [Paragonimus skrjabini miyazakii]|uniref:Uncharacterized protein n=1 Tax=Paragonimus skrjabini miyazakii TaxID=59628 RepID=A0A8S9YR46_9TREM|nr:hypothetical protein EG68_05396 [Paragonimus skrjabini miyazakii]
MSVLRHLFNVFLCFGKYISTYTHLRDDII